MWKNKPRAGQGKEILVGDLLCWEDRWRVMVPVSEPVVYFVVGRDSDEGTTFFRVLREDGKVFEMTGRDLWEYTIVTRLESD